jgi:hypothetical protein
MKALHILFLTTFGLAVPVLSFAATVETFGTGKGGLTAAGAGSCKLTSPQMRASVRFTAGKTGDLSAFHFGANPGRGYVSKQNDAFTVTLHADEGGSPGKVIARAGETIFNDGGARVRTARFAPGTALTAGSVYHLVISAPLADAAARVFGIEYALLGQSVTPVDSTDMERTDPAAAVLSSSDGGGSWTPVKWAIAAHEIVIGDKSQGWGYTGTQEFALKRGSAGAQYAMQTFRFTTSGGAAKAVPQRLRLALRPQGALAGKPVNVFAEIVTPVGFQTVAEASATVTLADESRFDPVVLPFETATLTAGASYVLIVGLVDEATATPKDFLFMRGYSWGIGSPNLHEVSWQGTAGCAYVSSDASALGSPIRGGDLPFLIEYLPAK